MAITTMPDMPLAVHCHRGWAGTLHRLADGAVTVLVLSHAVDEHPRSLKGVEIGAGPGESIDPVEWLGQWLWRHVDERPESPSLDPQSLIGVLTPRALRTLLTGHLVAVYRHLGASGEVFPMGGVVEETALRYQELTDWAETSSAWVLAQEYKAPTATIHNRLRLARQRGLLESPGAGARR